MDKLHKAKALFNIINDKKGIGVFTLTTSNQWYHKGETLTPEEKKRVAERYVKTIEIAVSIIGAEPAKSQQPKTLR